MTDPHARFKAGLVHLGQAGALPELLGCAAGGVAQVEFSLARSYHVRLTRRAIIIAERDTETIRRRGPGGWRRYRPTIAPRSRLVLDRASGRLLSHTRLGRVQP